VGSAWSDRAGRVLSSSSPRESHVFSGWQHRHVLYALISAILQARGRGASPQWRWIMCFLAQSHYSCAMTSVRNVACCTRVHVCPLEAGASHAPDAGRNPLSVSSPLYSTSPIASWHPPLLPTVQAAAAPAQAPLPRFSCRTVQVSRSMCGVHEWPRAGEGWNGVQQRPGAARLAPTCVHVFPGRRS
jgi:hypothetical protein